MRDREPVEIVAIALPVAIAEAISIMLFISAVAVWAVILGGGA